MKVGGSRQPKMSIEGCKLTLGSNVWRFERGHFVKQTDPFNCGPIACTKVVKMFQIIFGVQSKDSICCEWYSHIGYGALEQIFRTMSTGSPSVCERASSVTHTNR
jgi:hypothetical protein